MRIYYTTDGADPDTNSGLYTAPVSITETTTLKAFAVLEGADDWFPSEIMTEVYTLDPSSTVGHHSRDFGLDLGSSSREVTVFNSRGQVVHVGAAARSSLWESGGVYFVGHGNGIVVRREIWLESGW